MDLGIEGFVVDEKKIAVADAVLSFNDTQFSSVRTSEAGRFYKILLPGWYRITVTAHNYESQTQARLSDDETSFCVMQENVYLAFDL